MTLRYYCAELPIAGGIIDLPEDEAVHAARVMRVQPGDSVVLFSGDDRESLGTIVSVGRKQVTVELAPAQVVSRELDYFIHLAIALPKGDRAKNMIEKLTELGVARITPLHCERSQYEVSEAAIDKLRRAVIEACKQCQRNRLLQIDHGQSFSSFLREHEQAEVDSHQSIDLIAHPGGHSFAATLESQGSNAACILIGPEGGFTAEEVDAAVKHGWQRISLGERILRIETAAAAIAARLGLA